MASREISVGFSKYTISYEIIGRGEEIVFLHGWGAKKEVMKKAFGEHLKNFRQVYIDLPGFGASTIKSPLNTKDYAKIISAFLKDIGSQPLCIVGHSFGGKVGALLEPRVLVLLSSAGIPNKKRLSVRMKIAIFKFLKLFGFGHLYRLFASKDVAGMSAVMYETLKNVVNEDFSSVFRDCCSQALVFWGEDDKTTPLANGKKISELLRNCKDFVPLSGDHFFFLTHGKIISEQISLFVEKLQDSVASGAELDFEPLGEDLDLIHENAQNQDWNSKENAGDESWNSKEKRAE